MSTPIYLDDNGNPVKGNAPTYLDENGNPTLSPTAPTSGGGQRGSGSGRAQSVAPQDNPPSDYGLSQWLPSGRTVARSAGATVGGLMGAPGGPPGVVAGGVLGGATGEAGYRLIHDWNNPEAPKLTDLAKGAAKAGVEGGIQEGLGVAIPAIARGAARGLYRNALKPSTALASDEATNLVNTGLRERIPVSEKGLGKLNRTISGINDQIDTTIAGKPTAEVSPSAVARRIDPVTQDFRYKDLHKDLTAAEAEKARFVGEHSTPVQYSPYTPPIQYSPYKPAGRYGSVWQERFDPAQTHTQVQTYRPPPPGYLQTPETPKVQSYQRETPILAPRAQAMKKAIWQELAPNDFGTVAQGYKQARKAEGMGLKEELQGLFPRIQNLNAREGNLIELRDPLNRAVNRIANRNTIGIDAPLTAGAVDAITGKPGLSLAAAAAKVLPGSRTAIQLNRLAGAGRVVPSISRIAASGLNRRLNQ